MVLGRDRASISGFTPIETTSRYGRELPVTPRYDHRQYMSYSSQRRSRLAAEGQEDLDAAAEAGAKRLAGPQGAG